MASATWQEAAHPRGQSHPGTNRGSFIEKGEAPLDEERKQKLYDLLARAQADPRVMHAEALVAARGDARNDPGVLNEDGTYTPMAASQNDAIARSFLDESARAREGTAPVVTLLLGRPGAGKSTVIKEITAKGELPPSVTINSDDIMERIPGYRGELAASYHYRASDIGGMLFERALFGRYNVVLDTTGRNTSKMLAQARLFRQAGYRVNVVRVDCDDLIAGERVYQRFLTSGRYVPLRVAFDRPHAAGETYHELRRSGSVDHWRFYDTTSGRPILHESGGTHAGR